MAPPHHNNLQHISPPLPSVSTQRRCSKAQMCFFNILHIISAYPKPDVTHHHQTKQLLVDLNLVCNSESELSTVEEKVQEHSEISHHSSGIEEDNTNTNTLTDTDTDTDRDEGYLGLLFDAAQLILGADSEQDKKLPDKKPATARGGGGKRKQQCWTAAAEAEWYAEFEDTSPVVKSKRGRNQVLPFKYRDSVVEPLVRWTSSTATRRSK